MENLLIIGWTALATIGFDISGWPDFVPIHPPNCSTCLFVCNRSLEVFFGYIIFFFLFKKSLDSFDNKKQDRYDIIVN